MAALESYSDGYPDRGPAVFAVTTATLALSSVMVAARVYTRGFLVRRFSWDDRLIVVSWLVAFGLSFSIDLGTSKGLGRHDANIDPADRGALRRCEYVFSVLYNPALMATKSSILIFYLRLSKNTQKVLRFASWLVLFIVNIAGTVLTLLNIFQCRPVEDAWEGLDANTQCIPLLTEFICSAPINIVTDLAILALPIPVLTSMQLPSRQKVILVFTFSLGIFVTVVDVVRIFYLQQAVFAAPTGVSADPAAIFGGQAEFAWNASLALAWSAVEVNVGIACACIPTLKPLILRILPAMLFDPDGTRVSSTHDEKECTANGGTRNRVNSDLPVLAAENSGDSEQAAPTAAPVASSTTEGRGEESEEVGALEFLTTPETTLSEFQQRQRQQQLQRQQQERDRGARTGTTTTMGSMATSRSGGRPEAAVYFGFVNMQRPKSMLKCSAAEAWKYCSAVTILFFIWGMSYGLLNTLNNVVAEVSGMTEAQTLGLTTAYYGGGYFFGPLLVGEWILRRDEHRRVRRRKDRKNSGFESIGGFKATFITGLCIYGIGTIIFWPSAVTNSWGGFILSNFVVGFGLSVLETGANAFLILCGPPEHGETRLLFAQAVQAVGTVLSSILAQKVFFVRISAGGVPNSMTLINVQWTYLAVTLGCVVLALFFYYMPLPEVSDAELVRAADRLPVNPRKRSVGGLELRTWTLAMAVVAQYTYVAAQEGNNIFFQRLILSMLPEAERTGAAAGAVDADRPPGLTLAISDYLLIAYTAFATSRFLAGWVAYYAVTNPRLPRPRDLLTISVALSVFFALLIVVLKPANPNLMLIPLVLFYFSEGPCWSLIFAMGLRGQGKRTKRAAAFITMGGSGPGFFPFVMYGIIRNGGAVQLAFVVVLCLQVGTFAYPLFLECVRDAREMSEAIASIGTGTGSGSGSGTGTGTGTEDSSPRDERAEEDINTVLAERRRTMSSAAARERAVGLLGRFARGRGMSKTDGQDGERGERGDDAGGETSFPG